MGQKHNLMARTRCASTRAGRMVEAGHLALLPVRRLRELGHLPVAALRAWVELLVAEHGEEDVESIVVDMFRTLTSREPGPRERAVIADLFHH